jgi:DNA-binding MarR family transcriptional regulator
MGGESGEDATRDRAVRVLESLRDYRASERAMRLRTRAAMKMGEADLRALRFLLKAESEGRQVTPTDLRNVLGLKSSSITIMLDRLTASGHVRRAPHPTDRRSLVITATPGADEEVRHTLARMHERMLAVAAVLDPEQADTVTAFLSRATDTMGRLDAPGARTSR